MKIYTNETMIKRNRRTGQILMFAGMAVLIVGMVVSFKAPEQTGITLSTLLGGFLFSQLGFYFMNRFGRSPGTHILLNRMLKGLDSTYALYHYTTPTNHLLVGPAGIWVLSPRYQNGRITFSKGRWQQRGGNLYLKLFAQQGLGRPDLEISYDVEKVQKHLKELLPDQNIPAVQSALVFVSNNVEIDIDKKETPPAETLLGSRLKEFMRKCAKKKPVPLDKIELVQQKLAVGGEVLEEAPDNEENAD